MQPLASGAVRVDTLNMEASQNDIQTEDDIKKLVDSFYDKVRADELLSQCKQFWDSCGNGGLHVRRPHDTRAYFQSDRFYMVDGEWCCLLREGVRLGPFTSREEAARQLTATLAALRAP